MTDSAPRKPIPRRKSKRSGHHDVYMLVLGIALLAGAVAVAIAVPNLVGFAQWAVRVLAATGCALACVSLTGMLRLDGNLLPFQIRAGGALAVFIIVFFVPPQLINPSVDVHPLQRQDLACDYVWLYLGEWLPKESRYKVSWFDYAENSQHKGKFPEPGDTVVVKRQLHQIVTGYRAAKLAGNGEECDHTDLPPWGYGPGTEIEFEAGEIRPNSQAWLMDVVIMPPENMRTADGSLYVWARTTGRAVVP